MKKRFIFSIAVLLLFSYTSISGYEYHKETDSIEYLLNERINIMNEFLYGYKDMDDLEAKLCKIETGSLLQNDLAILHKVMDSPTDYELAINAKVDKIYEAVKEDEEYSINADLKWLMRGYDGEFNLIRNYSIKCIDMDEEFYLTELTLKDRE